MVSNSRIEAIKKFHKLANLGDDVFVMFKEPSARVMEFYYEDGVRFEEVLISEEETCFVDYNTLKSVLSFE